MKRTDPRRLSTASGPGRNAAWPLGWRGLFLVVVVAMWMPYGAAQTISFSIPAPDRTLTAAVPVVTEKGAAYISMTSLSQQLGGACSITPDHVQVDLFSKSAWLQAGSSEVTASLDSFFLSNPVLVRDNAVYVAVSDVNVFFEKAFRQRVAQQPVGEPAATPPAESAPSTPSTPSADIGPEAADELAAQAAQNTAAEPQPIPHAAPAPAVPANVPAEDSPPLESLSAVPAVQPATQSSPPALSQWSANRTIGTVIIDPGHGGTDPGCEGSGGLREGPLMLALAQRLQKEIEADGAIKAILTRDKDRAATRNERAGFANSNKGDLFLSLHTGAGFATAAHGFEIFCQPASPPLAGEKSGSGSGNNDYSQRSLAIAQCMASALAQATEAKDRGIRSLPCQVLKDVSMPALLIEVGFMTNPNEEALLQSEAYLDKIARGLAAGIKAYQATQSPQATTPPAPGTMPPSPGATP